MKLWYYQVGSNFGDMLNPWLFGRLRPDLLDDNASTVLLGIGTLLNDQNQFPEAQRIVVLGSGVGYGGGLPALDHRWTFKCVRGPLSARVLGLDANLAVVDPGVLVRDYANQGAKCFRVSYIPHWESRSAGLMAACKALGVNLIDPCDPVDDVLKAIGSSELVLAEAMHGAIVADALRVPWVAVRTNPGILRFKWDDWCASLGMEYSPSDLEVLTWSRDSPAPIGLIRRARAFAVAVRSLRSLIARARPQLSSEKRLSAASERLKEIISGLGET